MNSTVEPEISVFELWRIIRDGWLTIGIATAIGLGLGLIASVTIPVSYRGEVVIASAGGAPMPMSSGGGLLGQLGMSAFGFAGYQPQMASGGISASTLLQTRSFAERFIERHNLLPDLFYQQWDEETGTWKGQPPELWQGAQVFKKKFAIGEKREVPGTQYISLEWRSPERAATLANELVHMLNEVARERDIANAQRSLAYLTEQMGKTDVVELQRSLSSLMEQEQKTLMMANARRFYAFEIVDEALVPQGASSPNHPQLLVAGLVIGAFFGFAIVFLMALVRSWREEQGR